MTEYNIPKEPDVGSWVKDADNYLWENTGSRWLCRTDETISYRWAELLSQYGPLESYEPALEPKDGDIRFAIVMNDLRAFIVYKNGGWVRYQWIPNINNYERAWIVEQEAANLNYKAL